MILLILVALFGVACAANDSAENTPAQASTDNSEKKGWRAQVNIEELIPAIDGDLSKADQYTRESTIQDLVEICGGDLSKLTIQNLDQAWGSNIKHHKVATIAKSLGGDLSRAKVKALVAVWGGELNFDPSALATALNASNADPSVLKNNEISLGDLAAVWGGDLNNLTFSSLTNVWGGDLNHINPSDLARTFGGSKMPMSPTWRLYGAVILTNGAIVVPDNGRTYRFYE